VRQSPYTSGGIVKLSSFYIGSTPGIRTSDFHVGRYRLAKHLGTSSINVVDASPEYTRQLLLDVPSAFPSGRVAIFVCERCAGLDCGAITVAIEVENGIVTWKDFGNEAPGSEPPSFPDLYARTGPFYFDETAYRSALRPHARGRR
jgi:hypothetical protein